MKIPVSVCNFLHTCSYIYWRTQYTIIILLLNLPGKQAELCFLYQREIENPYERRFYVYRYIVSIILRFCALSLYRSMYIYYICKVIHKRDQRVKGIVSLYVMCSKNKENRNDSPQLKPTHADIVILDCSKVKFTQLGKRFCPKISP